MSHEHDDVSEYGYQDDDQSTAYGEHEGVLDHHDYDGLSTIADESEYGHDDNFSDHEGGGSHHKYHRHYHRKYHRHGHEPSETSDLGSIADASEYGSEDSGSHGASYRHHRNYRSAKSHGPTSNPFYNNMKDSFSRMSLGNKYPTEAGNRGTGFTFNKEKRFGDSASRNLANGGRAISRTLSKAISSAKPKLMKLPKSAPVSPVDYKELRPIESPVDGADHRATEPRRRRIPQDRDRTMLWQLNTAPLPPIRDIPETPQAPMSAPASTRNELKQSSILDYFQVAPPLLPQEENFVPDGLDRQYTPPYPMFNQDVPLGIIIAASEELGTSVAVTSVAMPDPAAFGVKV